MAQRYRRYLPAAVIVVVGLVLVGIIGFTSKSESAVLWSGGLLGVIAGVAIAAASGRDDGRGGKRR